jgi:hypothetical protein
VQVRCWGVRSLSARPRAGSTPRRVVVRLGAEPRHRCRSPYPSRARLTDPVQIRHRAVHHRHPIPALPRPRQRLSGGRLPTRIMPVGEHQGRTQPRLVSPNELLEAITASHRSPR